MGYRPIANPRNSVQAQLAENFSEVEDRGDVPPGLFQFCDSYGGDKDVALMFGCPCGCGEVSVVHLKPMDDHPVWTWDGDREHPTLTPSILIHQLDDKGNKNGEHWHGFLTGGQFRSC
jgi:hypothetical protein